MLFFTGRRWVIILLVVAVIAWLMLFIWKGDELKGAVDFSQIKNPPPQSPFPSPSEIKKGAELPISATPQGIQLGRDDWAQAFGKARNQRANWVYHQAAVTGKVSDIAVAKFMSRYCRRYLGKINALPKSVQLDDPARHAALQNANDRCFGDRARLNSNLPVRDREGLGEMVPDLLLATSGAIPHEKGSREALLRYVVDTRSIDLLASVSRVLVDEETMGLLGISSQAGISTAIDAYLVDAAIRLAACEAAGSCRQVALEDIDCVEMGSCVSDWSDYPAIRMFGSEKERDPMLKGKSEQELAEIQKRWAYIAGKIRLITQ